MELSMDDLLTQIEQLATRLGAEVETLKGLGMSPAGKKLSAMYGIEYRASSVLEQATLLMTCVNEVRRIRE